MINTGIFFDRLSEDINKRMAEAAEPLIQKALKEIEERMRRELAGMLIAAIDRNMSITDGGEVLTIRLRQAK